MHTLLQLQRYLETGGVTMYPLVACCFFMWALIIHHLPFWYAPPHQAAQALLKTYLAQQRGTSRHDRLLYRRLLDMGYERSISRLSTIKVLAALAPFLGLFGTVTGMINTFDSVAQFGLGSPKALAAGISEAMITTQFGLLIALPGVLASFSLQRRARRDHRRIEQMTNTMIQQRGGGSRAQKILE